MSPRRPPITSSLAASCAYRRVLVQDEDRCLVVDFVDVYPSGLHVKVSARFRKELQREAERARSGSWSFAPVTEDTPRLSWADAHGSSHTGAFTSNSSNAFLRTDFWCPLVNIGQSDVTFEFTWEGGGLEASFAVDRSSIASALPLWRELWPPEGERSLYVNVPE